MLDKTLSTAVPRQLSLNPSSLLDRIVFSSQDGPALTKTQAFVDRIVSHFIEEISQPQTMLALLGANFASRLTRIGVMGAASSLVEGSAVLPTLARGGSYALGLANESAAFAAIEGGIARWQGHSSGSFGKAWANSAVTLGSLRIFGALGAGQNIFLRHAVTDVGMVMSQHGGYALGITGRPQGSFAQQMMEAEVMNLSMEGSAALLHGLSPHLLTTEKSLDLYLGNRETGLFSKEWFSPILSPLIQVVEGSPEAFSVKSERPESFAISRRGKGRAETHGEGSGHVTRIGSSGGTVRLASEALILQALAHGPAFGLEIINRVQRMTSHEFTIQVGSLYGSLEYFLKSQLIETVEGPQQSRRGRPRAYYQLTKKGHKVVEAQRERFKKLFLLFGIEVRSK